MDTIDGQPRDYTSNRNPLVVLVCGVDIVGSTRNKMDNPNGWYFDVTEFFDVFDQKLRNKDKRDGDEIQNGWNLWRLVGDELLYYRVFEVKKISPDYSHLKSISKDVSRYVYEFTESIKLTAESQSIDLRGYSFILDEHQGGNGPAGDFQFHFMHRDNDDSKLCDYSPSSEFADWVLYEYKADMYHIKKNFFVDFVGRGVDQGFRLSEYSRLNQFVISPKLAYCLCESLSSKGQVEKEELELIKKMHYLGFYPLKGCGNEEMGIYGFPIYFLLIKSGRGEINPKDRDWRRMISPKTVKNKKKLIIKSAKKFIEEERLAYEELTEKKCKEQQRLLKPPDGDAKDVDNMDILNIEQY